MTPPETPIDKPIRFSFEAPAEPDFSTEPELQLPTKDPVYELLHQRIKQLEHENHHLAEVTNCFKKLFNPDQIKKLTGESDSQLE